MVLIFVAVKVWCLTIITAIAGLVIGVTFTMMYVYSQQTNEHLVKDDCLEYYSLVGAVIDCGNMNARQTRGVEIEGRAKDGDMENGIVEVWVSKSNRVNFTRVLQDPVTDGGRTSKYYRGLINGWQTYTWQNSTINGYCSVSNEASTEQNATLCMFLNFDDASHYIDSGVPHNALLCETMSIQGNTAQNFTRWGPTAPLNVTNNTYVFMVVDLPPESAFSSQIIVNQVSVNTSNLGRPKHASTTTSAYLPLSSSSDQFYYAICELLPPSTANYHHETARTSANPSLHIESCKDPRPLTSRSPQHDTVNLALAIAGYALAFISFLIFCVILFKRQNLFS